MPINYHELEPILQRSGPEGILHGAMGLMSRRRYTDAVPLFHFLAVHEPPLDPKIMSCAQYWLAECYKDGLGVRKNPSEAVRLLHLAAQKEFPLALRELAHFHDPSNPLRCGETPKSRDQALYWYEKAAEAGDVKSMFCLYDMYMDVKETVQAQAWLERAAALSAPDAVEVLALSLLTGRDGMETNVEKVVSYMRQGVEMGLPHVQLFYASYLWNAEEEAEMERVAALLAGLVGMQPDEVAAIVREERYSKALDKKMRLLRNQIAREWEKK